MENVTKKREMMLMISVVLKSLSVIFSIPVIIYNYFLGIRGVGPDGPAPFSWRLIGLTCFLAAIMCWVPNRKIIEEKIYEKIFFVFSGIPVLLVVVWFLCPFVLVQDNALSGLDLYLGMFFILNCFLLSPFSYLFYKSAGNKRDQE